MMGAINSESGIAAGLCNKFTFDKVDLVAWKISKEQPTVRYWMIEATMKEGHPHRYTMNLEQTDKSIKNGNIISLKQITRYWMYQECTPKGGSPEFCIC